MNDPIADLLARITNAQLRGHKDVTVPASKMLLAVVKILASEGFIAAYNVIEAKPQNQIVVELKYVDGEPAIRNVKRVSKPGIRRYVGYRDIAGVKNGLGLSIISTPKGIMTGTQARDAKVGGEIMCEIY